MTKTVTVNKTTNVVEVQSSGTVGPTGATGAQGAQGATGPQGPAGPSYTLPIATANDLGGVKVGTGLSINSSTGVLQTTGGVSLPIASASVLGGIKVGNNLSINSSTGVLDAVHQTGAQIKTAYEAESNTNAFTDAEKTKLTGIEASATADQTGAEIKTAYESQSDTNAFTDAEKTKLSGIATGAEVNVQADWNASSGDAQILNKPTIPSGDVVNDTSPQLGGNLDVNNQDIVSTSNANIDILPNGTGKVNLDGNGSSSGVAVSDGYVEMRTGSGSPAKIDMYCEVSNAHKVTLSAPPHSLYSGNVNFRLPPSNGTNNQILKTDGSGNTSWVNQPSSGISTGKSIAMAIVFG